MCEEGILPRAGFPLVPTDLGDGDVWVRRAAQPKAGLRLTQADSKESVRSRRPLPVPFLSASFPLSHLRCTSMSAEKASVLELILGGPRLTGGQIRINIAKAQSGPTEVQADASSLFPVLVS